LKLILLEFSLRIVSNGVSLLSVIAAIALPTVAAAGQTSNL